MRNRTSAPPETEETPVLPGCESFRLPPMSDAPFGGSVAALLIHGFTGTPMEMRGLGEYLAQRGIAAHCPRLPGHGTRVEAMRHRGWEDWSGAVEDAYHRLRECYDRVGVAGLSMGALLTLHLAEQYPVDAAVAMAPPMGLRWGARLGLALLGPFLRYWPKSDPKGVDHGALMANEVYDRFPLGCVRSLNNAIRHVRDKLSTISAPLLVIEAKLDTVIPRHSCQYVYEHVGSEVRQYKLIERSGHALTVDASHRVVYECVYQHMKTHLGSGTGAERII